MLTALLGPLRESCSSGSSAAALLGSPSLYELMRCCWYISRRLPVTVPPLPPSTGVEPRRSLTVFSFWLAELSTTRHCACAAGAMASRPRTRTDAQRRDSPGRDA